MPVSEKNAEKIINTYQGFTPTIIQSLNQIEAKAADFGAMKAAPLMSADVLMAANVCARFTQNIVAITPVSTRLVVSKPTSGANITHWVTFSLVAQHDGRGQYHVHRPYSSKTSRKRCTGHRYQWIDS